jgi:squalene-hopene/tetraprenyl-beta-curcumene cyclase
MKFWSSLALLGVGMGAVAGARAGAAPAPNPKAELSAAAQRGITFLRKAQGAEGAWQSYPGITAVCTLGILKNGVTDRDPAVARACDYLASQQKPNGAIYTDALGPAQALPNYNTALSLAALNATRNPKYAAVIKKAQQYLATSQFDEGEGFKPSDRQYGGIGYGRLQDNPDLSNLQNALEALRDSGYPRNDAVFKKAITFLQRCQNRNESNDQSWSGNDGGFIYAASGESKADEYTKQPHSSYGSMTYAGLKSYLYCNVSKSDPRVQAAWTWLRGNYDVEQNPRMGLDGLYYYYHTLSKTLALWGEKTVTDAAGKKHRWSADLTGALVKRQAADGSWKNSNARWRENDPILVTGYALMTLGNCRSSL